MANNPRAAENLIPAKKGEVRNPKGYPKGQKHISTWIDNLMHDPKFEIWLEHPKEGVKKYKGAPIKAIIMTAMQKAANGDPAAREWLAKYGYGSKLSVDVTINPVQQILDKFELGEGNVDVGKAEEA